MSPPCEYWTPHSACFPRVSGDEPFDGKLAALIAEFSPRERG